MASRNRECEVRFLNIDINYVKNKLLETGFAAVGTRFLQKRYVFDVNRNENSWIRLLEAESGPKLAYKRVISSEIDGTEEIEIEVSDFESTKSLLERIGYKAKSYQENFRTLYVKGEFEATIDEWPKLAPYLELEAKTKDKVKAAIKDLDLKYKHTTKDNVDIYKDHNIDLHSIKELRF